MAVTLFNPTVRINNIIVSPKPNSVSIVDGKGEKTVKAVSSGGGFSDIVVSGDVETRVGKIKMSFYFTDENYELLRTWKSVDDTVGSTITITEGDFHATMTGAVVINDPEKMIGVDEAFEVEFHGRPIV